MSSNIYENPMLTMSMRYSKGDLRDGEKVERVVDIYESGDAFTDRKKDCLRRKGGSDGLKCPPAVHRNPFRASTLLLALLCLLLVAVVSVVLHKFYLLRRTYEASFEEQQVRYANLSGSFCLSQDNGSGHWSRFGCSCYFVSTELKNWSESQADCVRRGADLVSINTREEDKFLRRLNGHRASWIGLKAVEKKNWNHDLKGGWEWEWVDVSKSQHLSWRSNESMTAMKAAVVYMDESGRLAQTTAGLRGWICEKQINTESVL